MYNQNQVTTMEVKPLCWVADVQHHQYAGKGSNTPQLLTHGSRRVETELVDDNRKSCRMMKA